MSEYRKNAPDVTSIACTVEIRKLIVRLNGLLVDISIRCVDCSTINEIETLQMILQKQFPLDVCR